MPGVVRKLLVIAAVDALFLQPHVHRSQKAIPGVSLSYGNKDIEIKTATNFPSSRDSSISSLEAHGVVGIKSNRHSSQIGD